MRWSVVVAVTQDVLNKHIIRVDDIFHRVKQRQIATIGIHPRIDCQRKKPHPNGSCVRWRDNAGHTAIQWAQLDGLGISCSD
ncbi:hypothetical protein D3C80_1630480 [compost metagenome]